MGPNHVAVKEQRGLGVPGPRAVLGKQSEEGTNPTQNTKNRIINIADVHPIGVALSLRALNAGVLLYAFQPDTYRQERRV